MLMHEAARHARDSIIVHKPNSITATFLIVRSCARAVFQNDCALAAELIRAHPLAREHLDVQHE
eukprot:4791613-Pyramimonas_sp.AAC.1